LPKSLNVKRSLKQKPVSRKLNIQKRKLETPQKSNARSCAGIAKAKGRQNRAI